MRIDSGKSKYIQSLFVAAAFAFALAGCGGGANGDSGTAGTGGSASNTVGGSVSGLVGSVVLQNNGGDNLAIAANGSFTFPTKVASGNTYNVTVLTQPVGQTCSVSNGNGTLSGSVNNVTVVCSASSSGSSGSSGSSSTYSVGGTVSGLTGSVVLQDNAGDNLSVSANGNFTFAAKISSGSTYNVTVLTQPAGQTCTVSTGWGTISGNNVTNVTVTCSTNTYRVWGTISGLMGSVVLQDNNGDNLTLTSNGSFSFATQLADGSPYSVTALTQPAGQTCSVANGTGTIAGFNVTDVKITCASYTYSVGGTVTGASGSMVMQDNGGDNLTVSTNGTFTFATALSYGSSYKVTVVTPPTGQSCAVTGGSGTVTANVSTVAVNCAALGQNVLTLAGTVSLFAGSPAGAFGSMNSTTGTSATFYRPRDLTSDGMNFYVADLDNNQIRKVVIATGEVTLFAGSPTGASGSTNGRGTAALFNGPIGITTDGTNLYVVDEFNNQIRKIVIATGDVTLFAGDPAGTAGHANGQGTAATFNAPTGIATDGTNLYVADYLNNQIRQIVIATGAVTLLAGSTTESAGMANGIGTAATFNAPTGIATDGKNLYVADYLNNQIRQIVIATSEVTLLAGSPTRNPGLTNGSGTAALFNSPSNIATDSANLYVADFGNNEIRQIVIATGAVTLLAGSATGASGLTNGTGTAARFYGPTGLITDGSGLYVADFFNNEIRRVQ